MPGTGTFWLSPLIPKTPRLEKSSPWLWGSDVKDKIMVLSCVSMDKNPTKTWAILECWRMWLLRPYQLQPESYPPLPFPQMTLMTSSDLPLSPAASNKGKSPVSEPITGSGPNLQQFLSNPSYRYSPEFIMLCAPFLKQAVCTLC